VFQTTGLHIIFLGFLLYRDVLHHSRLTGQALHLAQSFSGNGDTVSLPSLLRHNLTKRLLCSSSRTAIAVLGSNPATSKSFVSILEPMKRKLKTGLKFARLKHLPCSFYLHLSNTTTLCVEVLK